eukprot:694891-Pyramimonas_sp.AAC.1
MDWPQPGKMPIPMGMRSVQNPWTSRIRGASCNTIPKYRRNRGYLIFTASPTRRQGSTVPENFLRPQ